MEEEFWGCNLKYSGKGEYSRINYLVGLVLEVQPLPSIEGPGSLWRQRLHSFKKLGFDAAKGESLLHRIFLQFLKNVEIVESSDLWSVL